MNYKQLDSCEIRHGSESNSTESEDTNSESVSRFRKAKLLRKNEKGKFHVLFGWLEAFPAAWKSFTVIFDTRFFKILVIKSLYSDLDQGSRFGTGSGHTNSQGSGLTGNPGSGFNKYIF